MNSDIICIEETHFKPNTNDFAIEMENYTWLGHARPMTNARAPKASGGIGMLIKNTLLTEYNKIILIKRLMVLWPSNSDTNIQILLLLFVIVICTR